jgi:hypothetical protein
VIERSASAVGLEHVAVDHSVRSPSASRSITARRLRPISRWISSVRPDGRPRAASRSARESVEPGSIEYSAVSQPRPVPARKRGTLASSLTVHKHERATHAHSTEASGLLGEIHLEPHRAQRVGGASVASSRRSSHGVG